MVSITSGVQWPYLIWCELILLIFHHISYIKPVEMSSEYYPWVLYLFDHYVKWIIMHSHREAALRRYIATIFIKEDAFSTLHTFIQRLWGKGENSIASIWRNSRYNTGFICVCVCVCVCWGGGGGMVGEGVRFWQRGHNKTQHMDKLNIY